MSDHIVLLGKLGGIDIIQPFSMVSTSFKVAEQNPGITCNFTHGLQTFFMGIFC